VAFGHSTQLLDMPNSNVFPENSKNYTFVKETNQKI